MAFGKVAVGRVAIGRVAVGGFGTRFWRRVGSAEADKTGRAGALACCVHRAGRLGAGDGGGSPGSSRGGCRTGRFALLLGHAGSGGGAALGVGLGETGGTAAKHGDQ